MTTIMKKNLRFPAKSPLAGYAAQARDFVAAECNYQLEVL
jgi:hypothetical protein